MSTPIRPEELPGNSYTGRDRRVRKKLTRVATANRASETLLNRVTSTVINDAHNVVDYIFNDVMLPAVKDLLVNMVRQGIERAVYGEASSIVSTPRGYSSNGVTNYSRVIPTVRDDSPGYQREISRRQRASHDFRRIYISTRSEAYDVIDAMDEQIGRFGSVSVADLYDLVGITSEFVDESWGWYDLHMSKVRQTARGYILDLPSPVEIN